MIKKVSNREEYEGLRALWCEVFKDEPDFVDEMYAAFGAEIGAGQFSSDEIAGYVAADSSGDVVSALTSFLSGEYDGRPVWTAYAICTRPDMRGLGLAGELVEYARDIVLDAGGISLISPATESLEKYYEGHGYERLFYASERIAEAEDGEVFEFGEEDEEYEKAEPGLAMTPLAASEYKKIREEFLEALTHVVLGDSFMRLIYNECMTDDGGSGLYIINEGDALCALAYAGESPMIAELIVNPRLLALSEEIEDEIAGRIAKSLGAASATYRTPGPGKCQSMAAGIDNAGEAYYGFPID